MSFTGSSSVSIAIYLSLLMQRGRGYGKNHPGIDPKCDAGRGGGQRRRGCVPGRVLHETSRAGRICSLREQQVS